MKRQVVWQGDYLQAVLLDGYECVERCNCTGIVGIVPVKSDGTVVLIEQFRLPVNSRVIEFPAGLVGDIPGEEDESLAIAAGRELLEETGYQAGKLEFIFDGVASAGMSNEHLTYFLATDLEKTGQVCPGTPIAYVY